MENNEVAISDYYKLAVLDMFRVKPKRTEYNGRYWAYYNALEAAQLMHDYDAGILKVSIRDFVASVRSVKSQIFESKRGSNNGCFDGTQ